VGQFGQNIADHSTDHSESDWIMIETFTHFLDFLRSYYNDQEPLWLILDCYSVHRTENIKKHADKLGIHLVFIPARMTEAYQLLDRYIFGILKAECRRMYRQLLCDGISARMTKCLTVHFLIRVWEMISPHVLEQAWSAYFDDCDNEPWRPNNISNSFKNQSGVYRGAIKIAQDIGSTNLR
jgi:hypothetical protein